MGLNFDRQGSVDRKVLRFQHKNEREELLRLYRLTGLVFESVPESLLAHTGGTDGAQVSINDPSRHQEGSASRRQPTGTR